MTPTKARFDLQVVDGNDQARTVTTLIADGPIWFVDELDGIRGRYRPYEPPFRTPNSFNLIDRAHLRFVTRDMVLGELTGIDAGVAIFSTPLPAAQAEQLRNLVERGNGLLSTMADGPDRDRIQDSIDRIKKQLNDGITARIDVATGLVLQQGSGDNQLTIESWAWVDTVDESAFAIDETSPDHTRDMTSFESEDLLLLGQNGRWAPGQRSGDTDGRMLNMRTGHLRRVPFAGGQVMPQCFLPGRRTVVATGWSYDTGNAALYRVDLSTGETTPIPLPGYESSFIAAAVLSPDGGRLAVAAAYLADLESQMLVVDLATGAVEAVGDRIDTAFINWSPKGDAIILRNNTEDGEVVCRLDLDGTLTEICDGTMPVVLRDGLLLFRNVDDDLWYVCDMAGHGTSRVGDGLPGHGFPTQGPGSTVIMMEFTDDGPRPVSCDLATGERTVIVEQDGLWVSPVYGAWPRH